MTTLAPVGLSFALLLLCGLAISTLGWHLPSATSKETGLLFGLILGPVVAPMLGRRTPAKEPVPSAQQALYLDGKMKRYSLLFQVNGGAFAIAKLLDGPKPPGGLGIAALSTGAVVFSVLMTADIWLWGAEMRDAYGARVFRPVGQAILLMIGALLCSAWVLVGWTGG
ncbi:MAG TPA: hypothetical protein VJ813_15975 [Vicinamibacterales bacterium]|nr:hypothetical protein [Vicinamibacterales bacterium]